MAYNFLKLFLDIDECDTDVGIHECGAAGANEECNNTIGSYHCICKQGYQTAGDGELCEGTHSTEPVS